MDRQFWLDKFEKYCDKFGEDAVEYFLPKASYAEICKFLIEYGICSQEDVDKMHQNGLKHFEEDFVCHLENISGFLDIANSLGEVQDREIDYEEYYIWAADFLASDYATKDDRKNYLSQLVEEEY